MIIRPGCVGIAFPYPATPEQIPHHKYVLLSGQLSSCFDDENMSLTEKYDSGNVLTDCLIIQLFPASRDMR